MKLATVIIRENGTVPEQNNKFFTGQYDVKEEFSEDMFLIQKILSEREYNNLIK
jgi:hypothetical protein